MADFEVEEFKKCKEDFLYFAEKYLKVRNKEELVDFAIFDYHKDLLSLYETNRFVITKKYRQGGFSTFNIMYGLWKCLFNLDQRVGCFYRSDREACYHSEIVKRAINNLPNFLKPNLVTDNRHEKEFKDTNCSMNFYNLEAARSRRFDFIFIDEAAFIKDMEEKWKYLYPCVSTGGKVFIVSILNVRKDWFSTIFENAIIKNNQFAPFCPNYLDHPSFKDHEFVNQVKKNLGQEKFCKEFECRFPDSIDLLLQTKDKEIKSNGSFIVGCMNDHDFPLYLVKNCEVDDKELKISLYCVDPYFTTVRSSSGIVFEKGYDPRMDTDKFVHSAKYKKFDFKIQFTDSKGNIKDELIILNAQMTNKRIGMSYNSIDPTIWELTFEHNYLGRDEPIGQITLNDTKIDFYDIGQINTHSFSQDSSFLMKINDFKTLENKKMENSKLTIVKNDGKIMKNVCDCGICPQDFGGYIAFYHYYE